ncbi:hypothetical protein Gasu2_37480 [Galdieria sulphuraria]|nr:hypothetical protein Gasu2_37480 [Galdieria sulphuraria]
MEDASAKEQEEDKLDFYDDLFRDAPEIGNNGVEADFTRAAQGLESEQLESVAETQPTDPLKTAVSVSGLGWWFTDEELEQLACDSNKGVVPRKALKEIKFCYDIINGKSIGDAYLIFENSKMAQEAERNLQSHDFGRKVKVELTTEEVAQQETEWASKRPQWKHAHTRYQSQGRRNPSQKGAFEQSYYRGQGANGPFPGNAAHFTQKLPPSQAATMSAPPAFPFFTPFGFPAFPGMPGNMAGRGNQLGSNIMAANTAFGANNATNSNNSNNLPTARANQPDSSFFPPGFPPIPPHLFGYPPFSGMPSGSGFPGSYTSASATTGPFGNTPLNEPDSSAIQSNMPVSSASSRFTGDKDIEAKEEQSEHPSVVYSKNRETRTKQDHSQRRSSRDSSKKRHSKRHSHHEKKRNRHDSDSEDDSLRHNRSSRRKYRGDDHSRDRYEKYSRRSSHEERRGR